MERSLADMTLDDIIKMKRNAVASGMEGAAELSLDDYIRLYKCGKIDKVESPVPIYREDLSLDQIVFQSKKKATANLADSRDCATGNQSGHSQGYDDARCAISLPGSSKKSVPNIVLKPLDPCTTALDDIIEYVPAQNNEFDATKQTQMNSKRKTEAMDVEEDDSVAIMNMKGKSDKKGDVEQRQFHYLTPYRAVGFLTENGMIIEVVTGRLADDTGDRSHLWRCIVTCGGIKGIADSLRKVVAREMACKEFLQQLGQMSKQIHIPKYQVLDELFIDPRLFHRLETVVTQKALEMTYEVRVKPVNPKDELYTKRHIFYTYVCTYFVGKDKFKGEHLVIEYAKILAAREAFIALTEKEPQITTYFTGTQCSPSLQYNFNESEVYQTVARIEGEGLGKLPDDLQEAKIELARREVSDNFKKAKRDEVERRRNMPVELKDIAYASTDNPRLVVTIKNPIGNKTDTDSQPGETSTDETGERKERGCGRGRGRTVI